MVFCGIIVLHSKTNFKRGIIEHRRSITAWRGL